MLEFEIQTSYLRYLTKVMCENVGKDYRGKLDECHALVRVNKDGWVINTVDPAHVLMIESFIPKKAFKKYATQKEAKKLRDRWWEIYPGKDVTVSFDNLVVFDFVALKKIFGTRKVKEHPETMTFVFNVEKQRYDVIFGKQEHHLKMEDPRGLSDPKVPNLSGWIAKIHLPAVNFRKILKGNLYSDHWVITTEEHGEKDHRIVFQSHSKKQGVNFYRYPTDHKSEEDVFCMYSLSYIQGALKNLTGDVRLQVANDYPIEIFQEEPVRLRILIAPRIEGD